MKSYRQDNKILFKFEEDNSKTIQRILRILKDIVRICENRSVTAFPVEDIKSLVESCNLLTITVDDVKVPISYVDYVNTNKESIGFFKEVEKDFKQSESNLMQKKSIFKKFKEEVSEYQNIL
ncbi:hypothetical protein NGRA_0182 [Nosema granulosis]|uniref:Uncharacterized protein n=1 Tax=Nosema granulosis TaxID=83296 RepID=A0A9P6H1T8_9MICR|nr:hypothetical protein NGRA_0182 [Nosema granulosis]